MSTLQFSSQLNLNKHIDKTHKRNTGHQSSFDCNRCGRIFNSQDVDQHTRECEEEFIENLRECRYFKRGNCRKGDNCKFKHTKKQICRNGASCRYFAQGRCRFSHSSEATTSQFVAGNGGEFRYCLFGAQCRNLPHCPLIHYTMDFPYLLSSRNPSIMHKRNA